MKVVFEGYIQPVEGSPLATSPIRPKSEVNRADKYQAGDKDTARLPRMMVNDDSGNMVYTAYFPGSGIRGKLRRCSRDAWLNATGRKVSIEEMRTLTIGGVKGSGSEGSLQIAKIKALREENPVISLFGQSSGYDLGWVDGKAMIGMAVPEKPLTVPEIITGVRRDDLRQGQGIEVLKPEELERLEELAEKEREAGRIRKHIRAIQRKIGEARRNENDEAVAEFSEELEAAEEALDEINQQLDSDVSVLMPLSGYEVIPPGVRLKHRMVLRDVSAKDVMLFFDALNLFSHDPILGAHAAAGCGIVRASWDIRVLDGADVRKAGSVEVVPFDGIALNDESAIWLDEVRGKAEKKG